MSLARAAGLIDLAFAVFHILFWRLFFWTNTLAASGRINAAITQTLNLVLIYVFVAYGAALIWVVSDAGKSTSILLAAGAGFWGLRLAVQFALFPLGHWASVVVTIGFAVALVVHAWAAMTI